MGLSLDLDVFAGTSIHEAIDQAIAVADKIGVVVFFKHNGIRLMVHPGANPLRLYREWQDGREAAEPWPAALAASSHVIDGETL